jgi:hypothetical protein
METSSKSGIAEGIPSSSGPTSHGISTVVQIALVVCAALLVILVGITSAGVAEINSIDVCEVAPTQNEFLAITSVYGGPKNCYPSCNPVDTTDLEERVILNFALLSSMFGPFRLVKDSTSAEMVLLSNNQGIITAAQPVLCNYTFSTDAVATVFKYTSDQYERVVTTVPDEDGSYAACTTLDTSSAAYTALESNQEYVGTATLFDQSYMTKYAPIFDAATGQRIGALFAGVQAT